MWVIWQAKPICNWALSFVLLLMGRTARIASSIKLPPPCKSHLQSNANENSVGVSMMNDWWFNPLEAADLGSHCDKHFLLCWFFSFVPVTWEDCHDLVCLPSLNQWQYGSPGWILMVFQMACDVYCQIRWLRSRSLHLSFAGKLKRIRVKCLSVAHSR